MIRLYGWAGLLMIILTEINFFLGIQPFEKIYFPIIWLGYILFIDSLAFKIWKKSLINNNPLLILGMFFISAPFWKIFEFINLRVNNWHYLGTEFFGVYSDFFSFISFSTVIPAFFITLYLFLPEFNIFVPRDNLKEKNMCLLVVTGVLSFLLLMYIPGYFYPFEWIFLFLILDPINYKNKAPSLIYIFKKRNFKVILSIIFVSLVLGFLWEFWNFYASVKWIYTIPFFGFYHIFEMPLLGYLGYIPFGFTIFSFYFFIKGLFRDIIK